MPATACGKEHSCTHTYIAQGLPSKMRLNFSLKCLHAAILAEAWLGFAIPPPAFQIFLGRRGFRHVVVLFRKERILSERAVLASCIPTLRFTTYQIQRSGVLDGRRWTFVSCPAYGKKLAPGHKTKTAISLPKGCLPVTAECRVS